MAEQVVLSINPAHRYAARYVDAFHRTAGLRTVALWLDDGHRRRHAWEYAALRSRAIAQHVRAPGLPMNRALDLIAGQFDIVAVTPYAETALVPSTQAARHLGLSWYHPALDLVRDKGALKQRLREADPDLRVNATAVVRDVDDVRDVTARFDLSEFVLKPNDGFGNAAVAAFAAEGSADGVARHLATRPGEWLLEERLRGDEYFANGQVDAHGNVCVVSVGRHVVNPQGGGELPRKVAHYYVHTTDPEFESMRVYATRVVTALGLSRSAFHLEGFIDDRGPCLVEIGARLGGGGLADADSWAHGGGFDPYAVSARHLLDAVRLDGMGLDWRRYDRWRVGHVRVSSSCSERVHEVHGTREVAARPSFVAWWREPRFGDRMERTEDLLTFAWEARLKADTLEGLRQAQESARADVRWNDRSRGAVRRARMALAHLPVAVRIMRRWIGDLRTRPRTLRASSDGAETAPTTITLETARPPATARASVE